MRRPSGLPLSQRARCLAAVAAFILVAIALVACKSATEPTQAPVDSNTVTESFSVQGANYAQGTTSSAAASGASSRTSTGATGGGATGGGSSLATVAPANPTEKPDPTPAPGTTWPKKVGEFAKEFKKPVWYPTFVPNGFNLDSVDVVEFDPGSGLVCSIVFTDGAKVVQFTQGSPTNRSYDLVSVAKVPWGGAIADVVHEIPADTSSPITIVYSAGGNFAELSGEVSAEDLKAIAASMKQVK
jgi:hypothetical protein